ncbi:MAG: hypothetical protein QXS91_00475 [Candidatus Anstonellales archaeon]
MEEKNDRTLERGNIKNVYSYIKLILSADLKLENALFNYLLICLISTIFIGSIIIVFLNLSLKNYLPFLLFSSFSSCYIVYSYIHMKLYKGYINCNIGMMSGMITGMLSGFMAGLLIGATNGLFVGSVFGIIIGLLFGLKAGKMCGIMGALEGILAALMSGPMGAMISVMMIYDNLITFLYIALLISIIGMHGLSYMLYRELKKPIHEIHDIENEFKKHKMLIKMLITSNALNFINIFLIIFGPKSNLIFPI